MINMVLPLPAVHNVNGDELSEVECVQDRHADGEGDEVEDLCAGDGEFDHGDRSMSEERFTPVPGAS